MANMSIVLKVRNIVGLALLSAMLGGSAVVAVKASFAPKNVDRSSVDEPPTVVIAPRTFSYPAPGDYYQNGYLVESPVRTVTIRRPLTIMKFQVTAAAYSLCVDAGACLASDPKLASARGDLPVAGVSFSDAQAYAAWLSQATGDDWVLPSDEQYAFASGSRFADDGRGTNEESSSNPAKRWLADYFREAESKAASNSSLRPLGHFGENEFGVADFGGNVWEWTTTCSATITDNVEAGSRCGIYYAIGKHRAPMVFFVRDPKTGGCAVGAPPDNLGFRLVKVNKWYSPVRKILRQNGIL